MNENKKIIVTLVVFFLLIAGALTVLMLDMSHVGDWPFGGDESLQGQISQQESQILKFEKKIEKIPEREEVYKDMSRDFEVAKQLLPRESGPDELYNFIYNKAVTAGVSVLDLRSDIPTPADAKQKTRRQAPKRKKKGRAQAKTITYEEWRYIMVIRGSYDEIATFVNLMEEFSFESDGKVETRFFSVTDFSVSAAANGLVEQGSHECRMTLLTYRLVEK